jgi:hypothetical protein
VKTAVSLGVLALIGASLLTACSDQETVAALDAGVADAGTGDAGMGDAGPKSGAVVRTVETRNPFGAAPKNLLADGDFEWSVSGGTGSQFAWLSFAASGAGGVVTKIETGGICRSGIRCAVIDGSTVMLLRGAAAPNKQAMVASIAVKPEKGVACNLITAIALPCDTLKAPQAILTAPAMPDDQGWCVDTVSVAGSDAAVCIYVEAPTLGTRTALVDAAMLLPAEGEESQPAIEFRAGPALQRRLDRLHEKIRDQMPLGRAPERARLQAP